MFRKLVVLAVALLPIAARAGSGLEGELDGPSGSPESGVLVTVAGNNVRLTERTDGRGRFAFGTLAPGSYDVSAETSIGAVYRRIDVPSAGVHVTLVLMRNVGHAFTSSLPPVTGAGTDVLWNAEALGRTPAATSLPALLLQTPGAARGANGVVHMNGDHGDVNYVIDGMPVPQALNRNVGTEFDVNDASFVEVLEGAYPAQYGNRFASVVNVNTRVAAAPRSWNVETSGGSYGYAAGGAGFESRIGAGALVANAFAERSDRFLDPPNPDSPHGQGSNANEMLRYSVARGTDYWNVTATRAYQTFQIPNDVAGGEPADTNDFETQGDLFGTVQFHHALKAGGAFGAGVGYKDSTIRDHGDPQSDFIYAERSNVAAGGSDGDCAAGVVSACGFSLDSHRRAHDVLLSADDDVVSSKHDVRAGFFLDAANVNKYYAVALQPHSFLGADAVTVVDDAPNVGHDEAFYAQDEWKLGEEYRVDYGVRWDDFAIASTQFARRFSQVSPRVKVTRLYGRRAALYAYYGRFFTPFSLENVSPAAAHVLNEPLQPNAAQFDLKPQRDSDYEIGGRVAAGPGQLGFRVMQKNAADLIDDTQVGVTALHQDINYAQGRISTQSISYQRPSARAGRIYASATRTRSFNKGCETQLLAPCYGSPQDWTPADHDQTWSVSAGAIENDARDGWLSVDGEYGSGLSSAMCAPADPNCKVPPHLTFDAEKGLLLRAGTCLTVSVANVLNDRYRVTYLNAQGNHYAMPRAVRLGIRWARP